MILKMCGRGDGMGYNPIVIKTLLRQAYVPLYPDESYQDTGNESLVQGLLRSTAHVSSRWRLSPGSSLVSCGCWST